MEEMTATFEKAGLSTAFDPEGLMNRAIHVGVHPNDQGSVS